MDTPAIFDDGYASYSRRSIFASFLSAPDDDSDIPLNAFTDVHFRHSIRRLNTILRWLTFSAAPPLSAFRRQPR